MIGLFDQRMTAVGALEQAGEKIDAANADRSLYTLIQHPLHAVEIILVDDRLMRILDDDPLVGRAAADALCLVVDLAAFALHHVANVHLVLERAADGFIAPQRGIADCPCLEIHALIALVGRWIRDAVFVEMAHDPADARTAQI